MNTDRELGIVIKKHITPKDRVEKIENSITLRVNGEKITNRHPIWEFNPKYAKNVVFKKETIRVIRNRADVIQVVGYPLLKAALHFFDLGINMVDSSPHAHPDFLRNKGEDQFYAYIDIEVESLNARNTQIANQLVSKNIAEKLDVAYHFFDDERDLWAYRLFFAITPTTTPEQMEEMSYEVSEKFTSNE